MPFELDIQIPPVPRWLIAPVFLGQRLMYVDMSDWWVSRFCMADAFELEESALVRSMLRPGNTFVDIGANLGWFTLAASLELGPHGHIYSFEPRPDTGDRLAMTVALNGLSDIVNLHRCGVWSQEDELELFVGDPTAPGSSHVVRDTVGDTVITMPVTTIDNLALTACHFIKIDIEGAEPHAIRGAAQTIGRHRPFILSEVNGQQLKLVSDVDIHGYLKQLSDLGYDAFYAAGAERGTRASSTDERLIGLPFASVLFCPRERAPIDW